MPLIMFDIPKGRSEESIRAMLDAAHEAMLEAFGVPRRDRYQIVNVHDPAHMIVEDTGLGIERTANVTLIRVISRPRSRESKVAFYRLLTEKLAVCGIAPSDVMVSIVVNSDDDWSFGLGRAQFLTGEL